MDLARDERFHQLLVEALHQEPSDRSTFLARASEEDRELVEEVREYLQASGEHLGDFLESPPCLQSSASLREALHKDRPAPGALRRASATEPAGGSSGEERYTRLDRCAPSHGSGGETTELPTSVFSRLCSTRAVGLFVLLLLAMPVLIGAAALGADLLLRRASPELRFGSLTGRLTYLSEGWSAGRPGDEILAVGDTSTGGDPRRIRAALLSLEPGSATLRLRRGEEELVAEATLRAYTRGQRAVTWTRVVTGALLLLIGAGAFVLRPGDRVTWLFLFFTSSLGVHLLGYLAFLRRPQEGLVLETVGLYLAAATGFHLFSVFPRRLFRRNVWGQSLYLPSIAAVLLLVFCYRSADRLPVARGLTVSFLNLAAGFAAAAALASLGLVVVQFLRSRSSRERLELARSRALLVAVTLGLALPAVLGAARLFEAELDWMIHSFLVMVFATMMAFSLVRHNAFEVDRFTAAILGYGLTSLALAAGFAALVVGVPALAGKTSLLSSDLAIAAVTAAFFMAFHPLYRRTRKRVDRWFYREQVEDNTAVDLLRRLADSVRTSELSEALEAGLATARSLQGERAELWTRTPGGKTLAQILTGCGSPDLPARSPIPIGGPLVRALARSSGGVAGLVDHPLEPQAQEELWTRGLALAAPIYTDDRLQGFLGLSRKRNGARYLKSERRFLEMVASYLGLAMERGGESTERVGPYKLLERLGTGGMAEVYLAEKNGPGGFERRVAMKRMLPHLSQVPNCVAMFLDEARIAAQLHHPNIVQIYDIEKYAETYCLAMELVDGPALSTLIARAKDRGRALPVPVVAAVGVAVLNALGYVHGKADRRGRPMGLVHRDVKPGNVLLSRQGEIKLADFGIARAEHRLFQTQPGYARGTPAYMAPEQKGTSTVEARADLFSVGVLLYEALTGRMAFIEGSENRVPPVPLRGCSANAVPEALAAFLLRATAQHPEDRFATAAAMRAALLSAIAPLAPATAEEVGSLVADLEPAGKPSGTDRSFDHRGLGVGEVLF